MIVTGDDGVKEFVAEEMRKLPKPMIPRRGKTCTPCGTSPARGTPTAG